MKRVPGPPVTSIPRKRSVKTVNNHFQRVIRVYEQDHLLTDINTAAGSQTKFHENCALRFQIEEDLPAEILFLKSVSVTLLSGLLHAFQLDFLLLCKAYNSHLIEQPDNKVGRIDLVPAYTTEICP